MAFGTIRLQQVLHSLTEGGLARYLRWGFSIVAGITLMLAYQTFQFRGLLSEEAMETGHLARQIAEGRGFTTLFIRPFHIYLLEKHEGEHRELALRQPEIGQAPLYPYLLGNVFRLTGTKYDFPTGQTFFQFGPDAKMCVVSELLLLLSVLVFYLTARRVVERRIAVVSSVILLLCNALWQYAIECTSFHLLFLLFNLLVYAVVRFDEAGKRWTSSLWMAVSGLVLGVGFLTQYRFGILILPLLCFIGFSAGQRRVGNMALVVILFGAIITPWVHRNLEVTGLPFGSATYSMHYHSDIFPESTLQNQIQPKLSDFGFKNPRRKWMANVRDFFEHQLPLLGGNFLVFFFVSGLLFQFKSPVVRRLRQFSLWTIGWLLLAVPLIWNPGKALYSGNLYLLMIPFVFLFGTAFFFLLLDRFQVASRFMQLTVATLFVVVNSTSMIFSLLPPRPPTFHFPPYYPPMIHMVGSWMGEDELMMSDMPWAVCWYANTSCAPLATDVPSFLQINDYVHRTSAVFFTPMTFNRGLPELFRSRDCWGFILFGQVPQQFPLRTVAPQLPREFYFITDRARWNSSGQ